MQRLLLALSLAISAPCAGQVPGAAFVNFESPQTHPLAISSDGSRLFAVNTADNRVAEFSLLRPSRPVLIGEIEVGLEPVSLALRNDDELWVVNRLGDSVSVVSLTLRRVVATIRTADEPADVIFAGSPQRALVSMSGADELRIYNPATRALTASLPVLGDEPRALATNAIGDTVWLAVHRSGNHTTIVAETLAPSPPPPTNQNRPPAPAQGLLVDSGDPTWTAAHGITLPDYDVFEIDVASAAITRRYSGVGTTVFNIAVHPTSGDLWIANTEARNLVRFEPNLRGHGVDNRVTQLTPGASPQLVVHDLNPTIDYSVLPNPSAQASALAQPTDVVFSRDGSKLFVAAFGTDRVGIVDSTGAVTAFVELGTAGAPTDPRSKRGPRGLALHPTLNRLYVLNRLSSSIAVIDTASQTLLHETSIGFDPTPTSIARSRGFLYDAKLSGNGTFSCASCHVDGEIDGLAWDLGDPGGQMKSFQGQVMHPMKGPMTTQTLRGLDAPPFHWRGDRATLQDFNPAFDSLMGGAELSTTDINDYAAFMQSLAFPPNPNQPLDRTHSTQPAGTSAAEGAFYYSNTPFTTGITCSLCHALPTGTNGVVIPAQLLQESQSIKVPQLRNVYKRRGRDPIGGLSVSGFGLLHDGSVNTVFDLLTMPVFQGLSRQPNNKRKLEAFVTEFDTGQAPTVGYSVTATATNVGSAQVQSDLALLTQQAAAGNCELIAKGVFRGELHGFERIAGGSFRADASSLGTFTLAQLTTEVANGSATLTFTGVAIGTGSRIGVDRDLDGVLDADEAAARYGAATPACGTALTLSGNSSPHIGNAMFALVTDNATPAAMGLQLISAQQANQPFADLTILVQVAGAATLPAVADARGTSATELPIPQNASLIGQSVYVQSLFPEPCGQLGVGLSNGLRVTFGQ